MTTDGELHIRRIRPDDAELLRELRLRALLDSPSAFGSTHAEEAARAPREWTARARSGAEGRERVTFLAELAGQPMGLAGGYRLDSAADEVDLVSMWVDPRARRGGLARALVEAVVTWASGGGATSVWLWVTEGNEAAIELYQAAGFRPTGEAQPLPSDPSKEELRMVRSLANNRGGGQPLDPGHGAAI